MQKTINKIMASNVGELHSDLANLKNKVKKNTIELIEVYGEEEIVGEDNNYSLIEVSVRGRTFLSDDNVCVGGYIYYNKKEDSLTITQYEYDENVSTDDEIGEFPFDELNLDTQIAILDEVVNSHIPPKDRK